METFGSSRSNWKATVLPGALAMLAVLALQLAGFTPLTRVGQLIFDAYLRAAPRPYEPAPVRVVNIDEESIRRYGQWPWPRTDVALLTRRLGEAGAAVIALDIVFSEPDRTSPPRIAESLRRSNGDRQTLAALERLPDNDAELAKAFTELPVVTGFFLTGESFRSQAAPKAGFAISGTSPGAAVPNYSNAVLPLAPLAEAATGSGSVTLAGDTDGIVRKAPLLMRQRGELLPSLSLEALRVAQGAGAIVVKTSDGSGSFGAGKESDVISVKVGGFEVPTTESGALWMYYTAPRPERSVPAWKVLSGALSPKQMADTFGGHIVFVGAGAIGLRDLVSTPLQDRDLGVMIHAQAAEQMILGKFLIRPDWATGLERALVLALGGLLLILLPRLGAAKGAALAAVLAAGTLGGSWYAFSGYRFLLDPTYPMLAVIAVYVAETALTYYREERRRSYIHSAFDRYLSPELVRRIAADPEQLELGGEEREMTVMFCDIRNFSGMSEKLSAPDTIRFLIAFLTPMCDVLLARRATIDKFIGDAILAFWNAPIDDPDHHENAARAALAMVDELARLNREMPDRSAPDAPWPGKIRMGIGLNTGACCVGNMGSLQRLSYSLIGDTVNLASRIEGLTKLYGVAIAIGEALRQQIPHFATVVLDQVRVVGREAPEEISALIGDEQVAQSPEFRSFAALHAVMLREYRALNFKIAAQLLDETGPAAEKFGLGKVHALYQERVAKLELDPPEADWDGIYVATEK